MKLFIKNTISILLDKLIKIQEYVEYTKQCKKYDIPSSSILIKCSLEGNVSIGENTYLNERCRIDSGNNSKVQIGKFCAIGRYVHITSKTHNLISPTRTEEIKEIPHIEKDTIIGNYVWIGDKVFVGPGITIEDYAVIGTNSVVTRNVKPFEIVAGCPARHIKFNTKHHKYTSNEK